MSKIEEIQEVEQIPEGSEVQILSKNEKKARQSLLKLGLKQVKGISRVTFKRKGNFILSIDAPEVYKSAGGSYVVFGEAKVEDLNKRYAEAMKAQEAAQNAAAAAPKDADSITADLQAAALEDKSAPAEEEEEEGDVDETGLEAADIDIIVEQTNVSRAKAVKALKEHKGDMVNAIMALTS